MDKDQFGINRNQAIRDGLYSNHYSGNTTLTKEDIIQRKRKQLEMMAHEINHSKKTNTVNKKEIENGKKLMFAIGGFALIIFAIIIAIVL